MPQVHYYDQHDIVGGDGQVCSHMVHPSDTDTATESPGSQASRRSYRSAWDPASPGDLANLRTVHWNRNAGQEAATYGQAHVSRSFTPLLREAGGCSLALVGFMQ